MEWLEGGAISLTTMGRGDNSIEMRGMREMEGSLKDRGINTLCTL